MEKRKKVSIIITTYNRMDCLVKAIRSAQSQSYSDIEILVVNDYYEHNEVLNKKLRDCDVRLFHSNSSGANAARLLGFKNSNGEYIAFLDDDDYWTKNKIENQVNLLEKNKEAILVTSNARVFFEDDKFGEVIYGKSNPKFLDYGNFLGGFSFPLIKKEFIEESYFLIGLESGQDWYFWLRLRDKNRYKKFLETNTIEIFYKKSHISITNTKKNKILGFNKVYKYLKSNLKPSAIYWHRYTKTPDYNLGKRNSFKLYIYAFIDIHYFCFLFHILKLKLKKMI